MYVKASKPTAGNGVGLWFHCFVPDSACAEFTVFVREDRQGKNVGRLS